jgi:hypothetical protein
MGSSLDALNALNAPSSLTQRRQAASNLPNFELPPPSNLTQFAPIQHRYPSLTGTILPTTAAVSVGNLLTPPSNSTSDSSASSTVNASGATPNGSVAPVLPYAPFFSTPPGFHTGLTPQPWQAGGSGLFPPRSMFSPSTGLVRQSTNSPTAAEASSLPPPPYDIQNLPSYGTGFPLPSPTSANLASQQVLPTSLGRPQSQQSQSAAMETVVSKPASAPALFTQVGSSSHPPSGYPYSGSTPVSASPHSAHTNGPRGSPGMGSTQMPPQSQTPFIRPPYPSYSLPAMPGPTMSNISSPGSHMSMVGNVGGMLPVGFNSGFTANPQTMYGQQRTQSPASNPQNDRPFRCDSCPQSFHRNHDLKRHKRIHLSVKPFPCTHCDKSFSRKDALKVCVNPSTSTNDLLTGLSGIFSSKAVATAVRRQQLTMVSNLIPAATSSVKAQLCRWRHEMVAMAKFRLCNNIVHTSRSTMDLLMDL